MPSCVDSSNTTRVVKKKKKFEINTKERYFIFRDSLISQSAVESFSIEPKFKSNGEFSLLVTARLKSGNTKTDKITVVSSEQVKEKFGTCDETIWRYKGLNYDAARDNFHNIIFEGLLSYIDELLSSDCRNISWPLTCNPYVEAHAKKYLELIRETTDEEFEKIEAVHYYYEKLRELKYASRNEEEQNKFYEELKPLHKKAFGCPAGSLADILEQIAEAEAYDRFLSRR